MRSAFFSLLILSCAVMARGQVNPHTQIRWPSPTCSTAGKVYDFSSNTCIGLGSMNGQVAPSTQINWPGSCTTAGTVYSLQSNSCVAIAGVTWRGAWSAGTYAINDMVSNSGNTYISTAAGNTATPPSSPWALVAQAGATGPVGPPPDLTSPGPIGGTTPSTVAATDITARGNVTAGGGCPVGAPSGAVCSNGEVLSGGSPGIIVAGDSIGAGTGSTGTYNGYQPLLSVAVGGDYPFPYAVSGDQCADQNKNVVFTSLNPLGGWVDPVFVHELGTNDITRYTTTTNQQQIFRRCTLANLSWASIPNASKKFGGAGTLAGGFAIDASVTTLQAGLGAVCTTLSCTATYSFTSQTAGRAVYLWYLIKDTNGGTFTVTLNGVTINDPYSASSTWTAAGDGGSLISTQNGTTQMVAGARLGVTGSGTNTIVVTGTSATSASNIVEVYGVGIAPASTSANPVVVAVSPNPQNNANTALVATYSGFISGQVTSLRSDGLNVYFADTGSALLNIGTAVALPYTLTSTTQAIPGWVSDQSVSYAGTPNQPLTKVGSSPAQGQYSVSAGTYTINSADLNRPLIIAATVNCGSNSVTTLAANCYSDGLIHPNNEGHAVMAAVIAATIPNGNKNGRLNYRPPVRQTAAAPLPINPSQFWTPNPLGLLSSTAWNPGISLSLSNGNSAGIVNQSLTGITSYFPNTGGTPAVSFCPTVGGGSKQNIGPPPLLATCYFTLQANGLATFTVPTTVSRLTISAAGHTGALALPTSSIAAGTCTAGATLASGGDAVSSTTAVAWSYNADPTGVTGYGPLITGTSGGLSVVVWTTSVTINTKVCNNNTIAITPGALGVNVRALL